MPDLLMSGARSSDGVGLPSLTANGPRCGLKRLSDADATERAGGASEFAGHLSRLDARSTADHTAAPQRTSEPSAGEVTDRVPLPVVSTTGATAHADTRENARGTAETSATTDTVAESAADAVAVASTNSVSTEPGESVRSEPLLAGDVGVSATRLDGSPTDTVALHSSGGTVGTDRGTPIGGALPPLTAASEESVAADPVGTSDAGTGRENGTDENPVTAADASATPLARGATEGRAPGDTTSHDSRAALAVGHGMQPADEAATAGTRSPAVPLAEDRSAGSGETGDTSVVPNADPVVVPRASTRASGAEAGVASADGSGIGRHGAAGESVSPSGSPSGLAASTKGGADGATPSASGKDVAPESAAPVLATFATPAAGRSSSPPPAGSTVEALGNATREWGVSTVDAGSAGDLTSPGRSTSVASTERLTEAAARTHAAVPAQATVIQHEGIRGAGALSVPEGVLAGLSREVSGSSRGTTDALPALRGKPAAAPPVTPPAPPIVLATEVARTRHAQTLREAAASPARAPATSVIERLASATASGERLSATGAGESDAGVPVSRNASPVGTGSVLGQALGMPLATRVDAAPVPAPIAPHSVPLGGGGDAGELASSVRWTLGEGRGQALVNVTPAGLGPVAIRVSLEGEQMSVSILATQPGAREALESLMPRLREQLAADGHERVQVDLSNGQDGQARAGTHGRDAGDRSGTGRATGSDGDAHDVESLAQHAAAMHDERADATLARSLIDDWA